jgi:general stress protein 26
MLNVVISVLPLSFFALYGFSFLEPSFRSLVEKNPDSEVILAAASEIVEKAHFCALITTDITGQPQVRAMDPFPPDENWKVMLATNAKTRKVGQIRDNPRVALYYFVSDPPGYVTLSGFARLIEDRQGKERYWKDRWEDFYEDQNRGEDYLLIEVSPLKIEVVSVAHGIAADPKGWKPAIVEFPPPD